MPTARPRITITLTQRQHELLTTISQASGTPMSAYVVDLLEMSQPVIERVAATMTKMKQLNDERKASIATALEEAQDSLEPLMNAVLNQYDMFDSKLAEAVGTGAPAGAADDAPGTADPRPVITGVNKPKPAPKARSKEPTAPAKQSAGKARRRAV